MRANVLVSFVDKTNMADYYNAGDVFEGDEERINELVIGGYVQPVDETEKKPTRRRATKPKEV